MVKFFFIMSKIICFIGILAFVWSCGNGAETPQAPKVVSKKIAVAKPKVSKPVVALKKTKPAPAPQKQVTEKKPPKASPPKTPAKVAAATPAPPKQVIKPKPAPPLKAVSKLSSVDLAKKEKKVKATATTPGIKEETDKVPQMVMVTGVYDPLGKTDPFVPLYKEEPTVKKEQKKKKKKKRLPLTPLEKVDLSQLKLVGIIRASSGNKALVEEATGKGYIIKKGTYIGIHAGRVIDILPDRIVVEEETETTLGTYELQKRELTIKKPPGEM